MALETGTLIVRQTFLDRATEVPAELAIERINRGKRTGIYLHMMREKEPSPEASDPQNGARLWSASAALMRRHAPAD